MASTPSSSTPSIQNNPRKPLGLLANVIKRKDSFIQFIAMTGVLLLSMRSLGQKYRLHNLEEDIYYLREERDSIKERMKSIKQSLFDEAALDPTGAFASRLRVLFRNDDE
ncbi:hypothetical protein FRX31_005709 [Thalictrum thalictroides]|uniref:Uncharacterized protein n=1 Tax=Thalictrum thalictroides TaxID=46969 RepID=A0A7J6X4U0_THATH|nr:hypothetical protein FRX31_005709 [Thalictrum thalictroides]